MYLDISKHRKRYFILAMFTVCLFLCLGEDGQPNLGTSIRNQCDGFFFAESVLFDEFIGRKGWSEEEIARFGFHIPRAFIEIVHGAYLLFAKKRPIFHFFYFDGDGQGGIFHRPRFG